MAATRQEIARDIALALIAKSGVREWDDPEAVMIGRIAELSLAMSDYFFGSTGGDMALPDYEKIERGTAKVLGATGITPDALFTPAALANGAAWQSATLDLGANWSQLWLLEPEHEIAATPTAGATIDYHGSFYHTTGAGKANTSGSDATYTGYSSNADASVKQLEFLGSHVCTTQATTTVQKSGGLVFMPKGRYLNLVCVNRSGAAFTSSNANKITLTPLERLIQDTV